MHMLVLIPSSSGQQFGHRPGPRGRAPPRGRVLIPSSSGQQFGHGVAAERPSETRAGLNPFFIRAAIRTGPG